MTTLSEILLSLVALGGVTSFIMGALKKFSAWVNAQKPIVKQIIVVAIAAVVTAISKAVGFPLALDFATWSAEVVSTLLTAVVAYGLHSVKKAVVGEAQAA